MATDCIAQVRVDDSATVKVLRIAQNEVLTCGRNCASLEESLNFGVTNYGVGLALKFYALVIETIIEPWQGFM